MVHFKSSSCMLSGPASEAVELRPWTRVTMVSLAVALTSLAALGRRFGNRDEVWYVAGAADDPAAAAPSSRFLGHGNGFGAGCEHRPEMAMCDDMQWFRRSGSACDSGSGNGSEDPVGRQAAL